MESMESIKVRDRAETAVRLSILMLAIGLIGILAVISTGHGIPCPMHALTGFYCPGCGVTRMLKEIIHCNFYQAFRYNPFLTVTLPILVVMYFVGIKQYILNGVCSRKFGQCLLVYAVLFIAFGILRNIDVLSFLQPTII